MLTALQTRLAAVVRGLPEANGFALAGAGGLLVHGLIDRETRDLDYFTAPDNQSRVGVLRDALEAELDQQGLVHKRIRDLAGFVRLEVTSGTERCEVDLAVDYRALPPASTPHGLTLHPTELAANKVLAVFDRAEARDFLDLAALVNRFDLDEMIHLAARKDPGFTIEHLIEALGSLDRFTAADIGITEDAYPALRQTIETIASTLERERRRGIEPDL